MNKTFNTNAICLPDRHYMVDISNKLIQIKAMVDAGQYFTINRARQYGKTTTLRRLKEYLTEEYLVVSLDFQRLDASKFQDGNLFSQAFGRYFLDVLKRSRLRQMTPELTHTLETFQEALRTAGKDFSLYELFEILNNLCTASPQPIVLMIDEVDSASNSQVFPDFLAQLRNCYIDRDLIPTFQSVILSGVYDIKNLKHRLVKDYAHKINSPWNIAADFLVAKLKKIIYAILFCGESMGYNPDERSIDIALMFGFIKVTDETVSIANRIFETRLYNYFLTTDEVIGDSIYQSALQNKNQFIQNGRLNMRMILDKYAEF